MTGQIITQRQGAVAELVIDHPARRNALSLAMWQALEAALDGLAGDADLRVLILAGAGSKAFSAGADIARFEDERASREAVARYNETTARVLARLEAFPRPTLARIQGACVGGGVNLALGCDLRLCGASARFAIPAARLGLGYGFRGVERLAAAVGLAHALDIYYSARMVGADEARAMGLVNRVVPDERLVDETAAYAATIAANAPLTIAAIKAAAVELRRSESERDLARVERLVEACFESRDYGEGRRAFMAKRAPLFEGR